MNLIKNLVVGAVAALTLSAPASAHRMWMLPSTFTLSGEEQWVTIDGAISNDLFFPNHVPLPLNDITITAPDGVTSKPVDGWTGKFRSAFDVKLDKQGTWKITENGSLYFARWTEGGENMRRRGTLGMFTAQGLLDKPDVQLMKSARRVETFVTLGAPTSNVFAPTGKGLELSPVTHPNDVYAGETVTFKLLVNGAPVEGLEVEIVKGHDRYRDDPNALKLKTDAEGKVSFVPEEAGRYWLSSRTEGTTELDGATIPALTSYVATFEALAL